MTLRILALSMLLLASITLAACSQNKADVAGTYTAQSEETGIALTLNDNGKGTWSTDMDEISFRWSARKNGELWLHTKEGGVVRGSIENGKIRLSLPGVEKLVFERE